MSADWETPLRRIINGGDTGAQAFALGVLEAAVGQMLGELRSSGRATMADLHALAIAEVLSNPDLRRADQRPGPSASAPR